MRRYALQDREDYHKYNKLCGRLRSLVHRLSILPAQDPFRQRKEGEMLDRLYDMGILGGLHVGVAARARGGEQWRLWALVSGARGRAPAKGLCR